MFIISEVTQGYVSTSCQSSLLGVELLQFPLPISLGLSLVNNLAAVNIVQLFELWLGMCTPTHALK